MMKRVLLSAFILALLAAPVAAQVNGGGNTGGGGGSGDFSGPASSVDSNFVGFNGTGGKTGKDSGYSAASFAPAGVVSVVTGSNPTTNAASWTAFTQYTIGGPGRTITVPASSGLSTNGGLFIDANTNSVTLQANAADTITFAGATTATGGSVTLLAGSIYTVTTDAAGKLYVSGRSAQGNGTKVQLSTGSTTTNNCVKFDANGNTIDAGTTCGGTGAAQSVYVSGNWYNIFRAAASSGNAMTANTIYWFPFAVSNSFTLKNLGIRVGVTSAGGNIQLALYASSPTTGGPTGSALASTASLSTTSATNVADGTGFSVAITPGIYWFAVNCDNSVASVMAVANSNGEGGYTVGASSQANLQGSATVFSTQFTTSQTFGAWPSSPALTQAAAAGKNPAGQFQVN